MLTPGTTLWNDLADPSTGAAGRLLRTERRLRLLGALAEDERSAREAAAAAARAATTAAQAAGKAAAAAAGGASLADFDLDDPPPIQIDALAPAAFCATQRATQALLAAAAATDAARAAAIAAIPLAQSPCARASTANRL